MRHPESGESVFIIPRGSDYKFRVRLKEGVPSKSIFSKFLRIPPLSIYTHNCEYDSLTDLTQFINIKTFVIMRQSSCLPQNVANCLGIKDAVASQGLRGSLVTTISTICPFSRSSSIHIQSLMNYCFCSILTWTCSISGALLGLHQQF